MVLFHPDWCCVKVYRLNECIALLFCEWDDMPLACQVDEFCLRAILGLNEYLVHLPAGALAHGLERVALVLVLVLREGMFSFHEDVRHDRPGGAPEEVGAGLWLLSFGSALFIACLPFGVRGPEHLLGDASSVSEKLHHLFRCLVEFTTNNDLERSYPFGRWLALEDPIMKCLPDGR